MRLVTMRTPAGLRAGLVEGDEVVELEQADVGALLATGDGWAQRARAQADGRRRPLAGVDLAPVVPRPPKIVCLGLNYANHVRETGRELPTHPTLFAKFPIALIGARDPITLPVVSESVDWEAELGVVIGRPGRHIAIEDALDHVAGYTVVNDVSVRDFQNRTLQWLQGKTFEASTPVGPWLVTPDELPPGASGLAIACEVDGEVMQQDDTGDLIFPVAAVISYISQIMTLEPGDLISTGTPGGVGAARRPPLFLRPGQVVRTSIEGIGELVNTCVAESASPTAAAPRSAPGR